MTTSKMAATAPTAHGSPTTYAGRPMGPAAEETLDIRQC